ncbi:MAG: hypothetical protein ACPHF4_09255, partial [Rubripirellula sp.]
KGDESSQLHKAAALPPVSHEKSRRAGKSRKKAKQKSAPQNSATSHDFIANNTTSPTNPLTGPVFLAALISLISTNWEIIMATVMRPCPTTLIWLIEALSY